jgi:phosphoglycerate dehydrogenase-like enzyme
VLKPVTAAMIAQAPRLKLVQKLGVGVNTIDLDACKGAGACGGQHARASTARRSPR